MSDLIERQAVLDALCSTCGDGGKNCPLRPYCEAIDLINEVPSAVELIQCKDCHYFNTNWRCVVWHQFTVEHGHCYLAERKREKHEAE